MGVITTDEVMAALEDVVSGKGRDYVYRGEAVPGSDRRYVHFAPDGSPSDIVGHVLAQFGVVGIPEDHNDRTIKALYKAGNLPLDIQRGGIEALAQAEFIQLRDAHPMDAVGDSWGAALDCARAVVAYRENMARHGEQSFKD